MPSPRHIYVKHSQTFESQVQWHMSLSTKQEDRFLETPHSTLPAAEVPEYLAPAQEQGAIMIGVTGYPGAFEF